MTCEELLDLIEAKRQTYIDASLDIWDYAESIFCEYQSSKRLAGILENEGFTVTFGIAGLPTAFLAEWGRGKPVVGFMGEYDALPGLSQEADCLERKPVQEGGNGHGCGHHILGTAAMAAAIAAKDYAMSNHLDGTIRFYGCPAEEGGAGKVLMSNKGAFDDCAAAISWHPTDDNGIWSINFHAQQKAVYTFRGKRAADALHLFLLGAQNVRHYLDPCFVVRSSILNTGDHSGEGGEQEASILYAYRAHVSDQVREGFDLLHKAAKGASVMTDCQLTADYKTGTSQLLPNRTLEQMMYTKYEKVGTVPMTGEDWKYTDRVHSSFPEGCEEPTFDLMRLLYEEQAEDIIQRVRGKSYNNVLYPFREINIHKPGSTDICDVSFATPTVQCVAACYAKDTLGHSWQEVAQGRNAVCMKGMLVAAKVMALTGIELLENSRLVRSVREEFEQRRGGCSYSPMNARTTVENVRPDNQLFDRGAWPETDLKIQSIFTFTGVQDNGLAQRQTGKALTKNGNALEALEIFLTGAEYARKIMPASVQFTASILETGDEDMVKVPELTKVKIVVSGTCKTDREEGAKLICRVALGAAAVTDCQVKTTAE